jgi:RNA polymerase sigma factor (sigma-70 family)
MTDLGQFFTEHRQLLIRRFAWRITNGNRDEAEDLVHETFCRLFAQGPSIDADHPLNYVLTVGRHLYISRLRVQKVRDRMADSYRHFSHRVIDIERNYQHRELARVALRQIVRLNRTPRKVMLLKVWYDMRDGDPHRQGLGGRNQEVAERLGMQKNTVLVNICHARRALQNAIEIPDALAKAVRREG